MPRLIKFSNGVCVTFVFCFQNEKEKILSYLSVKKVESFVRCDFSFAFAHFFFFLSSSLERIFVFSFLVPLHLVVCLDKFFSNILYLLVFEHVSWQIAIVKCGRKKWIAKRKTLQAKSRQILQGFTLESMGGKAKNEKEEKKMSRVESQSHQSYLYNVIHHISL